MSAVNQSPRNQVWVPISENSDSPTKDTKTQGENAIIPEHVFTKALEKVRRFVAGVQPESVLIEPASPKVTMEMLRRLHRLTERAN